MANGVNKPFGLRPAFSITGGSWTEKVSEYTIYSSRNGKATEDTPIFQGDPVVLSSAPGEDSAKSVYPTIERYPIKDDNGGLDTVTDVPPVAGVFHSCEYTGTDGRFVTSNRWPGGDIEVKDGSIIKAYVYDDPMTVFDIQVSTSTNRLGDAIFAGDYIPDAAGGVDRKPEAAAYFGQNFAFGLAGGGANLVPDNPGSGDDKSGISGVYLNLGIGHAPNEGNRGRFTAAANAGDVDNAANIAMAINALRDNFVRNEIARSLPLKAIGFSMHPENLITEADKDDMGNTRGVFVRPFLNVRVVINNHVAKAGTYSN